MNDPRKEADRWARQAANDLAGARVLLREGFHAQACFTAQQVAGKVLKAVAYGRGERVVVGHSVATLLARLVEQYPDLNAFAELAGELDQYYVPTRYPNGLPDGTPFEAYNRRQAEAAVAGAAEMLSAVERILVSTSLARPHRICASASIGRIRQVSRVEGCSGPGRQKGKRLANLTGSRRLTSFSPPPRG